MARDTILFDINETVLDLSSLKTKFEKYFGDAKVTSVWFSSLLQSSTVCALTGVKSGFADLAGIMLDNMAARFDLSLDGEQRSDILGTFAALSPHPDIRDALSELKANGYRTVAFSNSSPQLISKQIENSNLSKLFDEVISVGETGSFKPDPKVYHFGAEKLNRPIEELRLVACHDWDTHGAMSAGMQAAFIDRLGTPYHPLYKKPDVTGTTMGDVICEIIKADQM